MNIRKSCNSTLLPFQIREVNNECPTKMIDEIMMTTMTIQLSLDPLRKMRWLEAPPTGQSGGTLSGTSRRTNANLPVMTIYRCTLSETPVRPIARQTTGQSGCRWILLNLLCSDAKSDSDSFPLTGSFQTIRLIEPVQRERIQRFLASSSMSLYAFLF